MRNGRRQEARRRLEFVLPAAPPGPSGQRLLVQRDQLAPRTIRASPVVDHAIADAPTVVAALIDLDPGGMVRSTEGLAQLVLGVRLPLVIVAGDRKVGARSDLRCEQMRAVRLIRDQVATVERTHRANATG